MISDDVIDILLPFVVQTETNRKGQCAEDSFINEDKNFRNAYSLNRKSSFDNEMDKRKKMNEIT